MVMPAVSNVVVCDVLGFLRHKFDRMPVKVVKSVLSDFYSVEVLSSAKNQLLDDISRIDTDAIFPNVPKRRDGDNRIAREVYDIFALFTVLDEQKLPEKLPGYVAESPDTMPSVRLYEGDLAVLLKLMKKLNGRIQELDEKLAAVVRGENCQTSVTNTFTAVQSQSQRRGVVRATCNNIVDSKQ